MKSWRCLSGTWEHSDCVQCFNVWISNFQHRGLHDLVRTWQSSPIPGPWSIKALTQACCELCKLFHHLILSMVLQWIAWKYFISNAPLFPQQVLDNCAERVHSCNVSIKAHWKLPSVGLHERGLRAAVESWLALAPSGFVQERQVVCRHPADCCPLSLVCLCIWDGQALWTWR